MKTIDFLKRYALGLSIVCVIVFVAYMFENSDMFNYISKYSSKVVYINLGAMVSLFKGEMGTIIDYETSLIIGGLVELFLVYIAIAKIILKYKNIRKIDETVPVPVAWTIFYFMLIGCLMLRLLDELCYVWWYAFWGGVAYVAFSVFSESDMSLNMSRKLFRFGVMSISAFIMLTSSLVIASVFVAMVD